jgi:adenylate cyclase, class 2
MQFEVEQKHRVGEGWDLAIRLAALGGKLGAPIYQSDQYFAHPCRDFAKSDEALRVRTTRGEVLVAYKGPKLDKKTKIRREIEVPLGPDVEPMRFTELLESLGFSQVAVVSKERRPFQVDHAGYTVEGAYDIVGGLGVFVELELIADKAGVEEAKQVISDLARQLDLGPSITRSYLEMLLAR